MEKSSCDPSISAARRALLDQIKSAQTALTKARRITDDAVHAARKDLKRARACLRLLRQAIGEQRYARANARLRDAARPWSRVRDARVLLDTAVALLDRERNARHRKVLLRLIAQLRKERGAMRGGIATRALATSLAILKTSECMVSAWSLDGGSDATSAAIKRLYRNGRKSMVRARADGGDVALHEARKQSKYLALALEVLDLAGGCNAGKSVKLAKAIGECLGTDHDLALIQARLKTIASNADDGLSAQIREQRRKLQDTAYRNARPLFKPKARTFLKRLSIS